jgi:phage-related protein
MKRILSALNAMRTPVGALPIVGIAACMVGGAAAGTAIAIAAKSAAVDPGCITAGSVGKQMTTTLNADKAAINRDQDNFSARQADLQRLVADLQTLQSQMTTAQAQATHPSVKATISAMITDLGSFSYSLQAVENGDLSQVSQLASAASMTQSDGGAVQASCTAVLPRP